MRDSKHFVPSGSPVNISCTGQVNDLGEPDAADLLKLRSYGSDQYSG